MGDILEIGHDKAQMKVSIEGTAPIESVDIFNGMGKLQTLRPYKEEDLGDRIKIMWRGAEKRGRARMVSWDGELELLDNAIRNIAPINFWNPDGLPVHSENKVTWKSVTTGGGSGSRFAAPDRGGALQSASGQCCRAYGECSALP